MKHIKKITALLLCLLLALGTVLPICAMDDEAAAPEESSEWSLSEDQYTLSYGDVVYERMEIPTDVWFRPFTLYSFYTPVDQGINVAHPVANSNAAERTALTDVAFLYSSTSASGLISVYASTHTGKAIIEDFCAGRYAQYELGTYHQSAVLSAETVTLWRNTEPNITIFAEQLSNAPYHYVFGYDATLSLAKVIGVIFEYSGQYLYVQGEQCLDINGHLSLRPGTITVHILNAEHVEQVQAAISGKEYYTCEDVGEQSEPVPPTISMALFLLIASPLMYILPTMLLALGIVMRCVKKIPNRKRWNAIIILSSLWLVGSFITSLLVLIPTFFL